MPALKISHLERCEILYALNRSIRENDETIRVLSEDTAMDLIAAIKAQNQGLELLIQKIKTVRTVG